MASSLIDTPAMGTSVMAMRRFLLTTLMTLCLTALSHASGEFRHVVLFKFKEDAPKEKIAALEEAFGELPSKIDSIKGFEWGTNVSGEGRSKGFTHCFLVTFADQKGLDVYLPHPAHQAFVSELKPLLDDVLVIDYVAK